MTVASLDGLRVFTARIREGPLDSLVIGRVRRETGDRVIPEFMTLPERVLCFERHSTRTVARVKREAGQVEERECLFFSVGTLESQMDEWEMLSKQLSPRVWYSLMCTEVFASPFDLLQFPLRVRKPVVGEKAETMRIIGFSVSGQDNLFLYPLEPALLGHHVCALARTKDQQVTPRHFQALPLRAGDPTSGGEAFLVTATMTTFVSDRSSSHG